MFLATSVGGIKVMKNAGNNLKWNFYIRWAGFDKRCILKKCPERTIY